MRVNHNHTNEVTMMDYEQFVNTAKHIAGLNTCYMLGPWGWSCTDKMIRRATMSGSNGAKNKKWLPYAEKIKGNGYIFDCVGLIKGILWGWSGDVSKAYGGAGYACNGVPDYGADQMIRTCPGGGSTDWSDIDPGEVVWMPGHIGIYVGDGVVVEATPRWDNGVQRSALLNIPEGRTLNWRKVREWKRHGKIPYVDYSNPAKPKPSPWAADAWNAAVAAGITDGSDPQGPATREQVIAMLYRAGVIPHD